MFLSRSMHLANAAFRQPLDSVRRMKQMHIFWLKSCYYYTVGKEAKLSSCN